MDASLAYEGLSNMTSDHREAMDALREARKPDFHRPLELGPEKT